MSKVDYILSRLAVPTIVGLEPVVYSVGEWLATADRASLVKVYDRFREHARTAPAVDGRVDVAIATVRRLLDGYFATREGIERVERLAFELQLEPRWREMMEAAALLDPGLQLDDSGNARWPKVEWDELRQRELVEVVPHGEAYSYALTKLGGRVLDECPAHDRCPKCDKPRGSGRPAGDVQDDPGHCWNFAPHWRSCAWQAVNWRAVAKRECFLRLDAERRVARAESALAHAQSVNRP